MIETFLKRTTLRQIEVVFALIEYKSMSRAAEALGVTVASVSRMSARLEHNLGITLFIPGRRRCLLSDDGRDFILRLRPLLEEIEKLKKELIQDRC